MDRRDFSITHLSLRGKERLLQKLYLDPIRKLSEVEIFSVVELHRIRVRAGQFAPLQSFFDARDTIAGAGNVTSEHGHHDHLYRPPVQHGCHIVTEVGHYAVFFVIPWVVRVGGVHASRAELAIQPRPLVCGRCNIYYWVFRSYRSPAALPTLLYLGQGCSSGQYLNV